MVNLPAAIARSTSRAAPGATRSIIGELSGADMLRESTANNAMTAMNSVWYSCSERHESENGELVIRQTRSLGKEWS